MIKRAIKNTKKQLKGDRRSIRKPLHKDTVSGRVSLQEKKKVRLSIALENPKQIVDKQLRKKIAELTTLYGKYNPEQILTWFKSRKYKWNDQDITKVEIYYFNNEYAATRKTVDTGFNRKVIESVTDSGIRKILLRHLQNHEDKPELAFSPEGILDMNKRISELNGGKPRQPIYKVRVYEPIGNKFPIGYTANKKDKYVEAAKGTNLYFGIYQAQDGTRTYQTVPLNEVIERMKQGELPVPSTRIHKEKEEKLLFWLSPNDLVYVPTEEERENPHLVDLTNPIKEQVNLIYKIVSSSGNQCFFIQ
ncbi:MAG: type II CRISPR RNA-guided endonuclease Cas9, partial [Tannerellaceae bacterium]|nr:type II CRISPR RNA-guided endonuclease Cas9 [Tannerellaceae bacterium]